MRGFERPLILTTMRWFSAARLADSLLRAGYTVSTCRPPGHPMDAVDGIAETHHLNRLWRQRSLRLCHPRGKARHHSSGRRAPLSLLRRLHADIQDDDPDIAELIAHSLGRDWSTITSRAAFATDARAAGIDAPETARITELEELEAWAAGRPIPSY